MRIANMASVMYVRRKDWMGRPKRPGWNLVVDGTNGKPRVFPTNSHCERWMDRHMELHEGFEYLPVLIDRTKKLSLSDWAEYFMEAGI